MKEGCENSGILQGGTIEPSGCQHALYDQSRNGKNGPKGDSEIQRAVTAIMDLGDKPISLFSKGKPVSSFSCSQGQGRDPDLRGQCCHPVMPPWAWRAEGMEPKGVTLEPSDLMGEKTDLMEIILPGLGLVWDLSPLLSCHFLPFGMGMSVLHLSHHDRCLVSQIHSWKGILSQEELYLEFHLDSYLCKWDFGL